MGKGDLPPKSNPRKGLGFLLFLPLLFPPERFKFRRRMKEKRFAFTRSSTGSPNTAGGIEKIVKTLSLRGVPSKTGIQWSANTIAVMLRNRVYSGQVRANGSFIKGWHQAIVSREQQDTAATIIKSRTNLPPRSHDSAHLLSGIARCGQCGKCLTVHRISKGRIRNIDTTGPGKIQNGNVLYTAFPKR